MLYSTEDQTMNYFSVMLCQNIVPQKIEIIMKLGQKYAIIEIFVGEIMGRGIRRKYLSKFM